MGHLKLRAPVVGIASALSAAFALWACGTDDLAVDARGADGATESGATGDATIEDGANGADMHAADAGSSEDAKADASDAASSADAMAAAFCLRGGADAGDASRDDECLARLDLVTGLLPYYRSHPLDQPNNAIQNVVLVQHGNNRNAWDYYDTIAALTVARDPVHTVVLAPLFQTSNNTCGVDPKGPNDLYWGCADWKDGNPAKNAATTSYAALDALLAAAKTAFPKVTRVTIAGYSAGGQTIQRYAAGNTEEARTPAIATRYVVASPGTYMYLDGQRLKTDATCPSAKDCAIDGGSFEVPAYAPGCTTVDSHWNATPGNYDDYKYGLMNRTGYLASIADADLLANYAARNIVYVVSEGDANTGGMGVPVAYSVLDRDCPSMVQGPLETSFRLQRGLVYHTYANDLLGAKHRLTVVPVCGHDETCVFPSAEFQAELF